MSIEIKLNTPGLTDVPGFFAAAVAADIRGNGKEQLDLGLIHSREPCIAAGVFTTNDVVAAPVVLCRKRLSGSPKIHGIVANSGNANACTGKAGEENALAMVTAAERASRSPENSFLVASTGRIGRQMPMDVILPGIQKAAGDLGSDSSCGKQFSQSILTSDTRPKTATARFQADGRTVTVAGVAKGAGMIQPKMATMLAFLATDLKVPQANLQGTLNRAVNHSFNRISVDGDMSTNDSVILLSNGKSGVEIGSSAEVLENFHLAVEKVCQELAWMIVGDGERINHVVKVIISGAPSTDAAEKVARAIGNSLLVKTSWYGEDPNWGRLLDAAGYAGIGLQEEKVNLFYDSIPVLQQGQPIEDNLPEWKKAVAQRSFSVRLDLGLGKREFELWTTDLTEGYVDYNKSE